MKRKTFFIFLFIIAFAGAGSVFLTQEYCQEIMRPEPPILIGGIVVREGKYFLCEPLWKKFLETIVRVMPAGRPDTGGSPVSDVPGAPTVPIENIFSDKIVYTTNPDANSAALRANCRERGGEFRECGSPCPANAKICIQVCAFTCELPFPR